VEIQEAGGEAVLIKADIKDSLAVDKTFKAFIASRNCIDFLVNNAAIIDDRPFALMTEKKWASVIQTNLGGTYNCCRSVVRSMIAQEKGIIINIGSIAGLAASPGQVNYAASKGGILSLTRTLAAELAPQGIRVNAIIPGFFKGGMAQKLDKRISEKWREQIPLKRFGDMKEVVHVVLFLASDESSYIIGQAIVVDGGLTL
jgi:3-oxoacyl-[acyl-carrier protein] reductase